eukprot:6897541-Prorocentrum_lima.AAC.1
MTSSFVGSEMCIRDSPKTRVSESDAHWKESIEDKGPSVLPLGTHGRHSVSYTHLTLPTICSV